MDCGSQTVGRMRTFVCSFLKSQRRLHIFEMFWCYQFFSQTAFRSRVTSVSLGHMQRKESLGLFRPADVSRGGLPHLARSVRALPRSAAVRQVRRP